MMQTTAIIKGRRFTDRGLPLGHRLPWLSGVPAPIGWLADAYATPEQLSDHVEQALHSADTLATTLPADVLHAPGLSSPKVRILLNRLVSHPGASYLEIGAFTGSTFRAALYGNHPAQAVAVDNLSYDGSVQHAQFVANTRDVQPFELVSADAFSVDVTQFDPFNVYFYDGGHTVADHIRALTHWAPRLAQYCIFVCDDWRNPDVRAGTRAGLHAIQATRVRSWELPARHTGDLERWWNGLFVTVLSL
jgi:hypothetical protein